MIHNNLLFWKLCRLFGLGKAGIIKETNLDLQYSNSLRSLCYLIQVPYILSPVPDFHQLTLATLSNEIPVIKMAVHHGFSLSEIRSKPSEVVQRRRRRQSIKIHKNIDDDVLMASAIGDVTWLQQSLYDTRKAYSVSKEHVSRAIECSTNHFN